LIYSFFSFVSELDLEKVMSPEEKKKLYEAIGYAGEDTSTTTYPDEVCINKTEAIHSILLLFSSLISI
jgi:hypothetical protein